MIRLDMELDYSLAFTNDKKSIKHSSANAGHLSFAGPSHPFARTKSPVVCEFSAGLGRRHRPGAGRRGAMGVVGPRGTSPLQSQDASSQGQIHVQEIVAPSQHNDTIFFPSANSTCFESTDQQHFPCYDAPPSIGDRIYLGALLCKVNGQRPHRLVLAGILSKKGRMSGSVHSQSHFLIT